MALHEARCKPKFRNFLVFSFKRGLNGSLLKSCVHNSTLSNDVGPRLPFQCRYMLEKKRNIPIYTLLRKRMTKKCYNRTEEVCLVVRFFYNICSVMLRNKFVRFKQALPEFFQTLVWFPRCRQCQYLHLQR